MRSIWLFAMACAVSFGLVGCKKNGGSNGGSGQASTLIKSYEVIITDTVLLNTSSDYIFSFSYDNSNRELTASQTGTDIYKGISTNLNFNAQFSYTQNMQTETGTLQRGTVSFSSNSVYYLNSSGYPTKLVSNITVGTITAVTTTIFTYDANGYCTETDNSSVSNNVAQPATKTIFTISGGNVVQEDNYWATGGLISTTAFTFGNSSNNTILRFSTPPIAGHLNNNLVIGSNTRTGGVPKSALNYSYSHDSKGRVLSATVTTTGGKTYMQYKNIQYLN
jgi:hypothetical protein